MAPVGVRNHHFARGAYAEMAYRHDGIASLHRDKGIDLTDAAAHHVNHVANHPPEHNKPRDEAAHPALGCMRSAICHLAMLRLKQAHTKKSLAPCAAASPQGTLLHWKTVMLNTTTRRLPVLAPLSVCVLAALAPAAHANQAEQANTPPTTLDTVQVTGSYLRRTETTGINPVQTIDRQEIAASGKVTVAELLRSSNLNTGNSFNEQFTTSFASGSAGLSLRGLSQKNTLILVDGYRVAPYGFAQSTQDNFVDLNALPLAAVERIEILKDGASALYGSDAIAGVVNIILRKDIEGLEADVSIGAATRGGTQQGKLALVAGHGDLYEDGFNLRVGLDVLDRSRLDADERELTRDGDYRHLPGGRLAGWSTAGGSWLTNAREPQRFETCPGPSEARPYADFGSATPGEACAFNTQQWRTLMPSAKRAQLSLAADIKLSDRATAFGQVLYSQSRNWQYFGGPLTVSPGLRAYNADTGRLTDIPSVLPADHADNPFGVDTPFEYTFFDIGARPKWTDSDFVRALAGVRGQGEVWDWELGANFSQSQQREYVDNFGNRFAFERVLSGDLPYSFSNPASTPAATDALRLATRRPGTSRLAQVQGRVSGFPLQFAEDQLGVAAGFEWRRESQDARTSPEVLSGTELRPAINLIDGSRDVFALFAETSFKPVDALEIQAAGRYDRYSDFGNAFSPKVGVRWQIADAWLLRFNASRGFRAPSLPEISPSTTIAYGTVTDPFDPIQPGASRGVTILRTGNAELQPEKSSNINLALLWAPTANASIGVDVYRIQQDGLIRPDSIQEVVANPDLYPGRVTRDAQGRVQLVENRYTNQGRRITTGADVELRQRFNALGGQLTLSGLYSRLFSFTQPLTLNGDAVQLAGNNRSGSLPRWRGLTTAGYRRGNVSGQLSWQYIDGYDQRIVTATSNPGFKARVPSYSQFDLNLNWDASERISVYANVQNLLDRNPPFDPAGGALPFDSSQYNLLGRYATLGVRYTFW